MPLQPTSTSTTNKLQLHKLNQNENKSETASPLSQFSTMNQVKKSCSKHKVILLLLSRHRMRYSYAVEHIEDTILVGACRFKRSYLLENLQEAPYDFRRDPAVFSFLSRSNYFKIGSEHTVLRHVEDLVVTRFIPVISEYELHDLDVDTHTPDPQDNIAVAKKEAQLAFVRIKDHYKQAKKDLDYAVGEYLKEVGFYSKVFTTPEYTFEDVLRRVKRSYCQCENC